MLDIERNNIRAYASVPTFRRAGHGSATESGVRAPGRTLPDRGGEASRSSPAAATGGPCGPRQRPCKAMACNAKGRPRSGPPFERKAALRSEGGVGLVADEAHFLDMGALGNREHFV